MGVKCFERECGTTRSQMGTSCCGVPGVEGKVEGGQGNNYCMWNEFYGFFFSCGIFYLNFHCRTTKVSITSHASQLGRRG